MIYVFPATKKTDSQHKGFQKFFDYIVHDLFLEKLRAYDFDYNWLELISSFLSGR